MQKPYHSITMALVSTYPSKSPPLLLLGYTFPFFIDYFNKTVVLSKFQLVPLEMSTCWCSNYSWLCYYKQKTACNNKWLFMTWQLFLMVWFLLSLHSSSHPPPRNSGLSTWLFPYRHLEQPLETYRITPCRRKRASIARDTTLGKMKITLGLLWHAGEETVFKKWEKQVQQIIWFNSLWKLH